jgi:transcriptional regulator GlxA family with amidase domain
LKRQPTPDYYFSVCTGAFILGKAEILNNLTVTTFHSSIENLKKAVPSATVLSNVRFVDNGKVITTAGISAGIDGALHLVAKIRGQEAARNVATYMEYDKWVPEQGLIIKK